MKYNGMNIDFLINEYEMSESDAEMQASLDFGIMED